MKVIPKWYQSDTKIGDISDYNAWECEFDFVNLKQQIVLKVLKTVSLEGKY